jgi:hypothetical protein
MIMPYLLSAGNVGGIVFGRHFFRLASSIVFFNVVSIQLDIMRLSLAASSSMALRSSVLTRTLIELFQFIAR